MPTAPSRKEVTHARIVATAARIIRRSGYDGVGVADIMKEAGLTHGGFYAHFPSKTALLAEAFDHARAESAKNIQRATEGVPPADALEAIITTYLSDAHVASPESGCPVASLASEMSRQEPDVRRVATQSINEMIRVLEKHWPGGGQVSQRREKAMATLSCLVGSLLLARAVDDHELSAALRDASQQLLRASLSER